MTARNDLLLVVYSNIVYCVLNNCTWYSRLAMHQMIFALF